MEASGSERGESVSSIVAQLACDREISERTAWRLIARARRDGFLLPAERHCEQCGGPLPKRATVRKRFCRDSCRARWHQSGERAASEQGSGSSVEPSVTDQLGFTDKDKRYQRAAQELIEFMDGAWPEPRSREEAIDQRVRFQQLAQVWIEIIDDLLEQLGDDN